MAAPSCSVTPTSSRRCLDEGRISELATGDFIQAKCNLLLIGGIGIGKTDLAIAIVMNVIWARTRDVFLGAQAIAWASGTNGSGRKQGGACFAMSGRGDGWHRAAEFRPVSSEADAGWRKENASEQKAGAFEDLVGSEIAPRIEEPK